MSFFNRHPRYTIALVVCLFVLVIILFNSDSAGPGGPSAYRFRGQRRPPPPPGLYTEDVVAMNEAAYQESLKERQKLIAKYGPTASSVEAFPSHGEFYTLWDFFTPAFQCPHRTERVGTLGDGGKWVCGLERIARKPKCVIYSFGVNGESSFEATLLQRAPGCEVWGYDFSVNSFGPEITEVPSLNARSHFYPYALGSYDAPESNPPYYTLQSLMKKNGHDFIDILKVDIEGAEFESLTSFLNAHSVTEGLPIGQLQLEIHARDSKYGEFKNFLKWWESLERFGLRPFWTEPNLVYVNLIRGVRPDLVEYSFINIRGQHELVSDEVIH
ncbi:hypothetical protein GLOTRDRAFT_58317 [Gloeophyllum trabeum ATCC 11539]|uniref:Methyltransferase domain-containing protein n=1 Tax=Gloeophyllum trabeum (strain ATCC 11539 / FP-39264 / Madison 617) TaxID=670483 RepID=S7RV94_GLOTA|nr:uncharacterized protein GLOTRDRAFT_58317 [Gloeophyllum trabeum ATCC 11539]EPQ57149.1 hypothetical protein GLOTRDRAFT_58317 [Gloeophyllum trabeum ATCC 11539]